ncbi:MAG: protein HflC [Gemmatales bacterium]|nr:MAG: protein HflC [Gemmatales bacterium]
MRLLLGLILVSAALVAVFTCYFTVDRAEYVYVTQFGRPVATYDGATEGGWHWKWPWPIQTVQRLDARLQVFDLSELELVTHDPEKQTVEQTLTVMAYVCWRIAGKEHVDRFIRSVGSSDRAQAILGERARSQLGAAIARMEMDHLFNTAPGVVASERSKLRQSLLDELRPSALQEYGIEVVDIRLRRTNHPEAVRDDIYRRIESERGKKVADYESQGVKLAAEIAAKAERKAREIRADADAAARRLIGEGDAEADRIRNEAQSQDPEFYAFLKKLEEYKRILGDNKTVLLLSSHRELFDMLFKPPAPNGAKKPATPMAPAGNH